MSYYVLWRGLYRDTYDTREQARKHALLALATVADWSPAQRKFNPEVRIVGEGGQEIEAFSVADELARVRENAKVPDTPAEA